MRSKVRPTTRRPPCGRATRALCLSIPSVAPSVCLHLVVALLFVQKMCAANVCTSVPAKFDHDMPRKTCGLYCETTNSHHGASPVALLRASFFLAAGTDDRAEDLALGAVAVCLQQLDVAVDEDALALLESVDRSLAWLLTRDHHSVQNRGLNQLTFHSSKDQRKYPASRKQKACKPYPTSC